MQKPKVNKYHLYLPGAKKTSNGYCKTACGRDGYKTGGLIPALFGMGIIIPKKSCKTCFKAYGRLKNARTK